MIQELVGPVCFRVCTKCNANQPLENFSRKSTGRYGRHAECKPCEAIRYAKKYLANPAPVKARNAAKVAANPLAERQRLCEWQRANPEKVKARNSAWKAANLDKVAAQAARRKAGRLKASPSWASKEAIGEVYKLAQASKLSVDHIYPLQGKKVCGLHVPANLRVLCPKVNSAKRDKLPGFLAHELWDPQGEDVFHG